MRRIAIINQKGGVGKTTTAVNLGAALAHLGRSVLLLDMDPQANMSLHLDRRPELEAKTMTQLLVDGAGLGELIQPTTTPGLHIVPADTTLAGVEQVLANRIGRETLLREAFEAYEENPAAGPRFDYLLMDCPPSLGVLSANALVAADHVLIPVQTEFFALQGMAKLLEVVELVRRRLNPKLAIACILPCLVDLRTNLTDEVLKELHAHFGDMVARSRIRANVKLAEAPSFGRTIFEHAPESNGARDYEAFGREFLAAVADAAATEHRFAGASRSSVDAPAPAPEGGLSTAREDQDRAQATEAEAAAG